MSTIIPQLFSQRFLGNPRQKIFSTIKIMDALAMSPAIKDRLIDQLNDGNESLNTMAYIEASKLLHAYMDRNALSK